MTHPQYTQKDLARFWAKVDKTTSPAGCWLWTASTQQGGYGAIRIAGHLVAAHRLAYELAHGPIEDGLLVLHNCPDGDNPLCCNPAHLFLGTHLDNIRDMQAKGRANYPTGDRSSARLHPNCQPRGDRHGTKTHPESVPRGEKNSHAKLTADQVLAIRAAYVAGERSWTAIGRRYGVTKKTAGDIVRRRSWKHLP